MEDGNDNPDPEESPIERRLREAEERQRQQQNRLDDMDVKERTSWGFNSGDAQQQAEEDEKNNPS